MFTPFGKRSSDDLMPSAFVLEFTSYDQKPRTLAEVRAAIAADLFRPCSGCHEPIADRANCQTHGCSLERQRAAIASRPCGDCDNSACRRHGCQGRA